MKNTVLEDAFERYSSLMKKSVRLINKASKSHRELQLSLIPYCAFPPELYFLLPKNSNIEKEEYYSDPENSYRINRNAEKDPDCGNCIYTTECNHFPASYLSFMGLKEVVPFVQGGAVS